MLVGCISVQFCPHIMQTTPKTSLLFIFIMRYHVKVLTTYTSMLRLLSHFSGGVYCSSVLKPRLSATAKSFLAVLETVPPLLANSAAASSTFCPCRCCCLAPTLVRCVHLFRLPEIVPASKQRKLSIYQRILILLCNSISIKANFDQGRYMLLCGPHKYWILSEWSRSEICEWKKASVCRLVSLSSKVSPFLSTAPFTIRVSALSNS